MDRPDKDKKFSYFVSKAENLCALKERCRSDMEQKLHQWEVPAKWSDNIISKLIENNFINDERFARAFVKDKFSFNHWGKIKIKTMLRQKGIQNSIIESALGQIDDIEYKQVLQQLTHSKWNNVNGSIYEKKGKTARFLHSRGFEYNLILEALDKVNTNEED